MPAPRFSLSTTGAAPTVTSSERLKIGVDAVSDALFADIAAIATSLSPAGGWDASGGSFPTGASEGTYYLIGTAGTVDGQAFAIGDWLIPLADDASTSTYAGNWLRGDYSKVVARVYDGGAELAASLEPSRGEGAFWQVRGGPQYTEVAGGGEILTAAGVRLELVDESTSATALGALDASDPDGRETFAPALVASLQRRKMRGVTLRDLVGRNYNKFTDAGAVLSEFIAELAPDGIAIHDPDNLVILCEEPIRPESGMKLHLAANSTILRGWSAASSDTSGLVSRADWSVDTDDFLIEGGIWKPASASTGGRMFSLYGDRWEVRNAQILDFFGSQAMVFGGDDVRLHNIRAVSATDEFGTGAFRMLGGRGFRGTNLHAEAGDDLFQFVPSTGSTNARYNQSIEDSYYIGCHGRSKSARVLVASVGGPQNEDAMTCTIRHVGWIGCSGYGGNRSINIENTEGDGTVFRQVDHVLVADCHLNGSLQNTVTANDALILGDYANAIGRVTFRGGAIHSTIRNTGLLLNARDAIVDIDGTTIEGETTAVQVSSDDNQLYIRGGARLRLVDNGGAGSPNNIIDITSASDRLYLEIDGVNAENVATNLAAVRLNSATAEAHIDNLRVTKAVGATGTSAVSHTSGPTAYVKDIYGNADSEVSGTGTTIYDLNRKNTSVFSQFLSGASTVSMTHKNRTQYWNGGSITITIPDEATNNLPVGFTAHYFNRGTGTLTIAGAAGVTLRGVNSLTQNTGCTVTKIGVESWVSV